MPNLHFLRLCSSATKVKFPSDTIICCVLLIKHPIVRRFPLKAASDCILACPTQPGKFCSDVLGVVDWFKYRSDIAAWISRPALEGHIIPYVHDVPGSQATRIFCAGASNPVSWLPTHTFVTSAGRQAAMLWCLIECSRPTTFSPMPTASIGREIAELTSEKGRRGGRFF